MTTDVSTHIADGNTRGVLDFIYETSKNAVLLRNSAELLE